MHEHDLACVVDGQRPSWLAGPAVPAGQQAVRRDKMLELRRCHWRVQDGRQFRQCQPQNSAHRTRLSGRTGKPMRRQAKGGDEQDVFTSWRRFYCWTQRAGACKRVKRKANRRERREAKQEIRRKERP